MTTINVKKMLGRADGHMGGPKAHQTPPEGLEFEGRVAPSNHSFISQQSNIN